MKESYGTLSETINALMTNGYTFDFNAHLESTARGEETTPLSPKDFEIDKVYRFEGASNPDDESVLYAISSQRLDLRGVLVNGYGVSTVEEVDAFIKRLRIKNEG